MPKCIIHLLEKGVKLHFYNAYNLPHQNLIRVLHKFVEFSFNNGCKDQLRYRKYLIVMATDCV